MFKPADLKKDSRILVLGHRGLVGSALLRRLEVEGYTNVVLAPRETVDLRSQAQTLDFFTQAAAEFVVLAAAKVGGIVANSTYPYDFIYDNLMIQSNVIEACRLTGVKKTLLLGSSCIYPRMAPQPLAESSLLTGPLEPTNEWYAVAKIAGIKMGQAARRQFGMSVISAMPTNLYGPNDNFDLQNSHVLPALIRKFHDAKHQGQSSVVIWGSGTPKREFLHVDDLAEALLEMLRRYDEEEILNIGCGEEVSIAELASLVSEVVGFAGTIEYDRSKPDGTPRKLTDISRLRSLMGWSPKISLRDGISQVYAWYTEHMLAIETR